MNSFYYKVCGVEYITFDTLQDARKWAKYKLSNDESPASRIRGAGRRIMRVNYNANSVQYYKI